MHWKSNPTPTPTHGDTRTRVRFAWMPKQIGEATYWLCQYEELHAYEVRVIQARGEDKIVSFDIGQWVLLKTRAIKAVEYVPA